MRISLYFSMHNKSIKIEMGHRFIYSIRWRCLMKKNGYTVARVLSLLLFIILISIYLLWLKVLPIKHIELQTAPAFLVASSVIGVFTIAINMIVLIRIKKKKRYFFILLDIISLILLLVFLWVFPSTGFRENNFNRIVLELSIENASSVSASAPADEIFPIDDDESIDVEEIAVLYGSNYTEWIKGEISNGVKFTKVLVIYRRGAYRPMNSITIFELNNEFDVTLSEMKQGYNRYTYPIEKILRTPRSNQKR